MTFRQWLQESIIDGDFGSLPPDDPEQEYQRIHDMLIRWDRLKSYLSPEARQHGSVVMAVLRDRLYHLRTALRFSRKAT